MNYRHAYHAGNFADVLKHAVLALVIEHLKLKPQPFRIIDVHAGAGRYDLSGFEASKTGEWRDGIGRILDGALPEAIRETLAPYLAAVSAENGDGPLVRYPGSPLIARHLMRPSDTLIANELHPEEAEQLKSCFACDDATKIMTIDAWAALKATLPPKERRGAVLIDPPFEEAGELDRLVKGLKEGARRFATGTFLLWYPIKDPRPVEAFRREAGDTGLEKILCAELYIGPERTPPVLFGTGLIIVNPPFTLEAKLKVLLPFLAERLARGPGSGYRLLWLKSERLPAR